MSPRDTYWFLAGAASGLMAGALAVYLLIGTDKNTHSTDNQHIQSVDAGR